MARQRQVHTLCVHHSAGPTGSAAEFRELHRGRGWSDVGYHAVLTNGHGGPDGQIQPGRPENRAGAGVWGRNTGLLQCVLVGQFSPAHSGYTGHATVKQLSALGHWLWANGKQYGARKVVGHKEIARPGHATACPGELPMHLIRAWYQEAITCEREADVTTPLHRYLAARGYAGKGE